jgi:hypothetical protein
MRSGVSMNRWKSMPEVVKKEGWKIKGADRLQIEVRFPLSRCDPNVGGHRRTALCSFCPTALYRALYASFNRIHCPDRYSRA